MNTLSPKLQNNTLIDWDIVKIGDYFSIRRGASPRPIDDPAYFSEQGRGWVRISDVTSAYKYLKQTDQYLSKLGETRSVKVDPGDLVMSICATIGKPIILDFKACIHDGFVLFTSKTDDIDKEFLFYLISYKNREIKNLNQTGTQGNLNTGIVRNISIVKPSKPEQLVITLILRSIDEALEKTDKLVRKYKSIKLGLMQDLFRYGIDEKGQIRNEKTHAFKNSEIGIIPSDWELSTIGDSYLKGRIGWQGLTTEEYLEDGEYYLVTGTDFNDGKVDWETCHFVEKIRYDQDVKIQLKNDDVLVTKDGTIGKIAIVENLPGPGTLNSGVFVIRPFNNEYLPKYLYYILRSFIFDKFIENLQAGSTINHLYQKDFIKFTFPKPKLEEQEKIVDLLKASDDMIQKEIKTLNKLIHLKNGLMQDLLTGKVQVNHLVN